LALELATLRQSNAQQSSGAWLQSLLRCSKATRNKAPEPGSEACCVAAKQRAAKQRAASSEAWLRSLLQRNAQQNNAQQNNAQQNNAQQNNAQQSSGARLRNLLRCRKATRSKAPEPGSEACCVVAKQHVAKLRSLALELAVLRQSNAAAKQASKQENEEGFLPFRVRSNRSSSTATAPAPAPAAPAPQL